MNQGGERGGMVRFLRFVSKAYAPGLHLGFSALWVLALLGGLVSVDPAVQTWILDPSVLFCILSVFLALFVLRAADEIKDYEYDRTHNPDRPLVTGAVRRRDLVAYIAGTSLLLVTINALLSWVLLAAVLVDIGYGLFLVWVEKRSERIRESIFLNLFVTYPVNVGLSVYTYFFFLAQLGGEASLEGVFAIIAFAAAFLHWEFCRKTCWPHHAKDGMRLYSAKIGAQGSSWVALAFALTGTGIMIALIKPWTVSGILAVSGWLILSPVLFALLGLRKFYSVRSRKSCTKRSAVMIPFGTYYLVLFYGTLIQHGIVANDVVLRLWANL